MISLRSKPARAGIPSALTLLMLCVAMLALPAASMAAPGPEEGSPEPPLPQLAFEPGSYDFGLQQANSNSSQTTMQLRNNGEAAAPVYSLELNGGSGAFWLGQSDCYGRTLNPNEGCYIQVNFGPYDAASFSAQLRVSSEGGASFTANLRGEGGRANTTTATDPNFGSVPVGSEGVIKVIDITNTGNYPGGSFIAVIAGGAIGSFHLLDENCTGIPLLPGATCNLVIKFQPLSTGAKTARLGLFGDSDGGVQIMLTGVGLDPLPVDEAETPVEAATVLGPQPPQKQRTRRKARRNRGLHRKPRIDLASRRATH